MQVAAGLLTHSSASSVGKVPDSVQGMSEKPHCVEDDLQLCKALKVGTVFVYTCIHMLHVPAVLWPPKPSSTFCLLQCQQHGSISSSSASLAEGQPEASTSSSTAAPTPGAGQDASQPSSSSGNTFDKGMSTGFRRVRSQINTAHGSLSGIVHVNNSFNNIIVALTDMSGNLKTLVSAGQVSVPLCHHHLCSHMVTPFWMLYAHCDAFLTLLVLCCPLMNWSLHV